MNLEVELKDIISARLGVPKESIENNSDFSDDFNADPMTVADLLTAVQEKFEVSIPKEEIVSIRTVSDLYEAVNENLS